MDFGTPADWVNVICTLAATGAAFFAGTVAHRAYMRERANDHQRDATGVHAWLAYDTEAQSANQRIILMNSGQSPIYELAVRLILGDQETVAPSSRGTWQVLPPGRYEVGPNDRFPWGFPNPVDEPNRFTPYTRSPKHRVIGIDFTDAHGTAWHRDARGHLTER